MDGNPAKIGKYDVTGIIGRGGMGVVYKAVDPQIGRFVAIKMITAGVSGDQDLMRRFYREAHSTGSLQNPNIVTVFDLGEQDGNPYLVMEYLEGVSLESVLASRKPLSLIAKLKIILDVCHGLTYAHQRGVIHRDIKPANIMVLNDGTVKIVDFGIAHIGDQRMTRTGQVVGSLSFMSPEQLQGKTIDSRTDVFSTGVVLYELITSSLPFDGENTAATLMKIISEPPPPLKNFLTSYPPELEAIIARSLAKNRDERYSSADDFALDVGQLLEQVKRETVVESLQKAETLFSVGEFFKAKDELVQLLKIDRQNTKAVYLLREVQQRLKGTDDRGLLEAQADAEKQRELALRQRFIEEQLVEARRLKAEGHTQESVRLLEGALAKVGNEPRLRSLLSSLSSSIARDSAERASATETPVPTAANDSATELFSGRRAGAPPKTGPRSAEPISVAAPSLSRGMPAASAPLVATPASLDAKATNRKPIYISVGALSLTALMIGVWMIVRQPAKIAISTVVPLEIITTPPGASVSVKGTDQKCTTPSCHLNLPPGKYDIEAQLSGYESVNRAVTINSAGPNSVQISLNELPAPPSNTRNANQPLPLARLRINRATVGAEVFIDGEAKGRVRGDGLFSTDVPPGNHTLKLHSQQGDSSTIAENFSSGNTLYLKGTDFSPAREAQPAELADWQRVKSSQNIDEINQFLSRYPNGSFRSEAESNLEELYWAKENAADNPAALRDYLRRYPGGKHQQAANTGLARLEWQTIANTKDPAPLENYLRVYSSGEYHDKAYGRLDDLLWERTGRGDDASSLRSYLQTFPTGRHADQVRRELDQLTAPRENANTNQPNHAADPSRTTITASNNTTTSLPATDDKTAVLNVLSTYEKLYEGEDLPGMQKLWPGMTPQQIQGVGDFFKNASSVKLTCIPGSPKIGGTEATVEFKQELSYVMNGSFQRPNRSKVNMKLKKTPQGTWLIDSIH